MNLKREEKKEKSLRRFSRMEKAGRGTVSPSYQPATQAEVLGFRGQTQGRRLSSRAAELGNKPHKAARRDAFLMVSQPTVVR